MPFEARNQSFIQNAPWNKLKAVRENRIYYLPDQKNDMLSRPTLRVVKGIAWLGSICHPGSKGELVKWANAFTSSAMQTSGAKASLHNVYVKN